MFLSSINLRKFLTLLWIISLIIQMFLYNLLSYSSFMYIEHLPSNFAPGSISIDDVFRSPTRCDDALSITFSEHRMFPLISPRSSMFAHSIFPVMELLGPTIIFFLHEMLPSIVPSILKSSSEKMSPVKRVVEASTLCVLAVVVIASLIFAIDCISFNV